MTSRWVMRVAGKDQALGRLIFVVCLGVAVCYTVALARAQHYVRMD